MTSEDKLKAIAALIASPASKTPTCDQEDFVVYDWCGGNVDDAYAIGSRDGEIILAQQIEAILNQSE